MARTESITRITALSYCGLALLLQACSRPRQITVGSKNFTEQVILGEIAAQHIENRLGKPVARKLNLGGTLLAHQALVAGEIDVYPEYTGTALTAILKLPPAADAAEVLNQVRQGYRSRWKLEWLDPLGFNNTFAMAIRGEDSRARNLEKLSDAAASRQQFVLGAGYEFMRRPDGLPALQKTYNLPLAGTPRTMDLGLLYKALEQKQVDMVAANATDGMLSVLDCKVLRDDRNCFPPYEAALVVRVENSAMTKALAELSGKFTTTTMQKLNYEVDGKHRPVAAVAREFLESFVPRPKIK